MLKIYKGYENNVSQDSGIYWLLRETDNTLTFIKHEGAGITQKHQFDKIEVQNNHEEVYFFEDYDEGIHGKINSRSSSKPGDGLGAKPAKIKIVGDSAKLTINGKVEILFKLNKSSD